MKVTAILNFVTMLKDESCSDVCFHHTINKSFNSIIICFVSCFPMHCTITSLVNNLWIKEGIIKKQELSINKKFLQVLHHPMESHQKCKT
jgi:hypothetical protein